VIQVGDAAVFVKRVPLTDLELAHVGATRNLFELPMECHFGVGSPGFGAWRELVANQRVSAEVLAGRAEGFPILHHHRVLAGAVPGKPPDELADVERMVAFWGGSAAVRARLEALAASTATLVLCFERVPHRLVDRMTLADATWVERSLLDGVGHMARVGVSHFDAHEGNWLGDGERVFFCDFGLAGSDHFDNDADERAFLERHRDHDRRHVLARLTSWLVTAALAPRDWKERNALIERVADGQDIGLTGAAADVVTRHAKTAVATNELYRRLQKAKPRSAPSALRNEKGPASLRGLRRCLTSIWWRCAGSNPRPLECDDLPGLGIDVLSRTSEA
jgi:hypothetical protein